MVKLFIHERRFVPQLYSRKPQVPQGNHRAVQESSGNSSHHLVCPEFSTNRTPMKISIEYGDEYEEKFPFKADESDPIKTALITEKALIESNNVEYFNGDLATIPALTLTRYIPGIHKMLQSKPDSRRADFKRIYDLADSYVRGDILDEQNFSYDDKLSFLKENIPGLEGQDAARAANFNLDYQVYRSLLSYKDPAKRSQRLQALVASVPRSHYPLVHGILLDPNVPDEDFQKAISAIVRAREDLKDRALICSMNFLFLKQKILSGEHGEISFLKKTCHSRAHFANDLEVHNIEAAEKVYKKVPLWMIRGAKSLKDVDQYGIESQILLEDRLSRQPEDQREFVFMPSSQADNNELLDNADSYVYTSFACPDHFYETRNVADDNDFPVFIMLDPQYLDHPDTVVTHDEAVETQVLAVNVTAMSKNRSIAPIIEADYYQSQMLTGEQFREIRALTAALKHPYDPLRNLVKMHERRPISTMLGREQWYAEEVKIPGSVKSKDLLAYVVETDEQKDFLIKEQGLPSSKVMTKAEFINGYQKHFPSYDAKSMADQSGVELRFIYEMADAVYDMTKRATESPLLKAGVGFMLANGE